jgi:hypothetical protein
MKAKKIWFDKDFIHVETTENKIGKMPLKWFKRLEHAKKEALEQFELWNEGRWIHWELLGEDLSVEGFFTFNKEFQTSN